GFWRLFRRGASERSKGIFDPRLDLADHQLHRAHRRAMRGRADLEREAYMRRFGGADFVHQLFGHGLDIADQQIVADLFERRLVRERAIDELRALHDLLAPPEARGEPRLVARVLGEAQTLFPAVGDMGEPVDGDMSALDRDTFGGEGG